MEVVALVDPAGGPGEDFKQAAKELGLKIIGVFSRPFSIYEAIYHVDEAFLTQGCHEVIVGKEKEEVLGILKRHSVKAVIAVTDSGVEWADQIAHSLGLWGNDIAYSEARRNKGEMRKTLKAAGLPYPAFAECYTPEQVSQFAKNHSFPLVIKTPKGGGTSQVFVCEDLENLMQSFHQICGQKDLYGLQADHALLEEYIGGKEYIVDTFSDGENVHVTDIWVYDKIDSAHFKNIYYNAYTLPLDEPSMQPLIHQAIKVAKAFRIQRGAAHIELKDDPVRGPTLIEVGARVVGSGFAKLIKKYTNFPLHWLTIEVFVHGKVTVPHPILYKKHLAVCFCPVFEKGRIEKMMGIEQIQQLDSYEFHALNVKRGDFISPTTDLTTVPLVVYLAHSSRAQIQADLLSIHAFFQLEVTE